MTEEEARKITEKALEMISDVFFVFDLEGGFMKWNKRVIEVTGYSDDEISCMKPLDLFAGADAQRVADAFGRVMKLSEARVEAQFTAKDGHGIPYEFAGSLLKDSLEKPYAIAGTGRDVSERKRAEAEIHLMSTAKEKFLNAVAISDMGGNLTYFNCSFLDTWGYEDKEQVLGRSAAEFWETREDAEKVMSALRVQGHWHGELPPNMNTE